MLSQSMRARALDDDFYVETRVGQYEALHNGRGCTLAKRFVAGKLEGQNNLLEKYGLETSDTILEKVRELDETDLKKLRRRLMGLEGKFGRFYFKQVFRLFPSRIRPHYRSSYNAYDGSNNMFNLAYRILFWKCYKSLSNSHLEPYLGFLHNMQFGRASLVCDFMELYRHLVDGFLIEFSQGLKPRDFVAKPGTMKKKSWKRMYLTDELTREMVSELFEYFQKRVPIPRDRIGKRQRARAADSQRIQSIRNCFQVCLSRVVEQTWKPQVETSGRRHTSSTRSFTNCARYQISGRQGFTHGNRHLRLKTGSFIGPEKQARVQTGL